MKRLRDILPLIVVLVGLAIMAYPTISNFLVERNASRVVSGYEKAVSGLSDEDAQAMMDAARAYNAQLAGLAGISADQGGADAGTVSSTQLREQYSQLLNLNGDGVMGYITIPRLDETLPIYHGTDEATLQVGVGHIDTSSLPVGGVSTHAALSGHRGLPSAKLFTDLDQMKKATFSSSVCSRARSPTRLTRSRPSCPTRRNHSTSPPGMTTARLSPVHRMALILIVCW